MASVDGSNLSIGIVGGGKGGNAMLERFMDKTVFVVDLDEQAQAMVEAKRNNIRTYTDLNTVAETPQVVFEATGSEKVLALVRERFGKSCAVIDHKSAEIMEALLGENIREITEQIRVVNGRLNESSHRILALSKDITRSSVNLNMLGINASIEAGRAGENGRGFAVVAQHMADSANDFKKTGRTIQDLTLEIGDIAQQIQKLLAKL